MNEETKKEMEELIKSTVEGVLGPIKKDVEDLKTKVEKKDEVSEKEKETQDTEKKEIEKDALKKQVEEIVATAVESIKKDVDKIKEISGIPKETDGEGDVKKEGDWEFSGLCDL